MCCIDVSTFWGSLLTNIIAGIAILILVYYIQQGRYYWYLKRRFDNSIFDVYYKNKPEVLERIIKCTVKKNIIKFDGENVRAGSGEGKFSGEFIMNPFNLKTGEGLHVHKDYNGFNFPKIIIKDNNTFFVQTSYVRPKDPTKYWEFEPFYQAYIWKRRIENGNANKTTV